MSFLCVSVVRSKLKVLTSTILSAFGFRPMINRHAVARSKVDIILRIMFISILNTQKAKQAHKCNADDQVFNGFFNSEIYRDNYTIDMYT